MSLRALLFLGALSGCGAGPGTARDPLIGGAADDGDPAVVSFAVGGYPACSGSLVGKNTVLTAGHCARLLGDGIFYDVRFGADARKPTRTVKVTEQLAHPQYSAEGAPYDFALLRLHDAVTDVTPLPLGTAPLSDADVGADLRHVGFGVDDEAAASGGGFKRTATWPLARVDDDFLYSGGAAGQTCTGDSGGPALLLRDGVEQLVGVVSDGPDCHSAGWDGRVDRVAPWVRDTAQGWAGTHQACSAAPGPAWLWFAAVALSRRRRARAHRFPAGDRSSSPGTGGTAPHAGSR
jgi:hypothetical protein